MMPENPFGSFRRECEAVLENAVKKAFPKLKTFNLALERPPNPQFGQLASSLCFELSKQFGEEPPVLAERITNKADRSKSELVERVSQVGGYVNFHVNFGIFSALTIQSAEQLEADYGLIKTKEPVRIIVEHTSVNPLHPIHIGQARNPVLGDSAVRLLKARGHTVSRHYYIDDVGRQTSVTAYGYDKLGRPGLQGKPDHFLGPIYTITSCIVEINRLKKELERAKTVQADEEVAKFNRELDEWVTIAAELQSKHTQLFNELSEKLGKDEDHEAAINKLNKAYEAGGAEAKELVRGVSELCLNGFRETLSRIDISYDSWDWESDFVWSNSVTKVLQSLKESPYVFEEGGVLEFDGEKAVEERNLRTKLSLRAEYRVPPLTLLRADGTTLYTTRDVAYSLWKFGKADRVINVIGTEQNLAQLQLKIALYALGYGKYADNLVHLAYNLVTLPGYKMSSRRGHYITFDEVMDEAVRRAYEEVSKRSPNLSEEEKHRIANFVGIGAVRYALVEVDIAKPVVFTWDRILNFEKNSAPYIQYTHARACSILRKAAKKPEKPNYELLHENLEHDIVLALASFPETFIEAAEYLKPNLIADSANALSDKFNTFYNAFPVIKAEPPGLSNARLALTDAVRIVLRNSLDLIGIVAPERM
jgi:arginyl-tRNA synthetase